MNEYDPTSPHETPHARPRRPLSKRRSGRIVAAALTCAAIGLSVGLATSAPASAVSPAASSGSNARSGPAAGGSSGTVDSVSKSGFTLTTSAGQKVTVNEASSTKYQKGTARPRRVPSPRANPSSYSGRPVERRSRPRRSSCRRVALAGLRLPRRQRWSPSSAAHRPRQSRSVRSRRTTARGQGRSSAERQRTRQRKLPWPPTRAASSTVS